MKLAKLFMTVGMALIPALGMARNEPSPDMELLEFLGGFETARGTPVDPLVFADTVAKDNKKGPPDTAQKDRRRSRKPEKPVQKGLNDEK